MYNLERDSKGSKKAEVKREGSAKQNRLYFILKILSGYLTRG